MHGPWAPVSTTWPTGCRPRRTASRVHGEVLPLRMGSLSMKATGHGADRTPSGEQSSRRALWRVRRKGRRRISRRPGWASEGRSIRARSLQVRAAHPWPRDEQLDAPGLPGGCLRPRRPVLTCPHDRVLPSWARTQGPYCPSTRQVAAPTRPVAPTIGPCRALA